MNAYQEMVMFDLMNKVNSGTATEKEQRACETMYRRYEEKLKEESEGMVPVSYTNVNDNAF